MNKTVTDKELKVHLKKLNGYEYSLLSNICEYHITYLLGLYVRYPRHFHLLGSLHHFHLDSCKPRVMAYRSTRESSTNGTIRYFLL